MATRASSAPSSCRCRVDDSARASGRSRVLALRSMPQLVHLVFVFQRQEDAPERRAVAQRLAAAGTGLLRCSGSGASSIRSVPVRRSCAAARPFGDRPMRTTVSIQAFATREPPVFATKEAERRHVQERLAVACRILGRRGLSEGLLGRIPRFAIRCDPTASGSTRLAFPCTASRSRSWCWSIIRAPSSMATARSTRSACCCTPRCTAPGPTWGRYATPMHLPHRPGLLW